MLVTLPATGSITNGATAVSAITESMVSNTVQSGIIAFERRRKIADDIFDAQMAKLVLEVSDIQHQVAQMADQIQHTVIEKLTANDGVISKLIIRQDDKIDEMKLVMFQMAASLKDLLQRVIGRNLPPHPYQSGSLTSRARNCIRRCRSK
jgi:hypothetical protein